MKPARPWVFICLAGVLLGCGQKGPLVMPDAQKHKRSIPAPPASPKPANDAGANTPAPAPAGPGATPPKAPDSLKPSTPTDSPAHP